MDVDGCRPLVKPSKAGANSTEDNGDAMVQMRSVESTRAPTYLLPRSGSGMTSSVAWEMRPQQSLGEASLLVLDGDADALLMEEESYERRPSIKPQADDDEMDALFRGGFMTTHDIDFGMEPITQTSEDMVISSDGLDFLRSLEQEIAEMFAPIGVKSAACGSAPGACAPRRGGRIPSAPVKLVDSTVRSRALFRKALRGGSSISDVAVGRPGSSNESSIDQLPPIAGAAGAALRRNSRAATP